MGTLAAGAYFAAQGQVLRHFGYTENGSRIGSGLRQRPGVEIPVSGSYVPNIDPLAGTQPRELSRSPEPILEPFSVCSHLNYKFHPSVDG